MPEIVSIEDVMAETPATLAENSPETTDADTPASDKIQKTKKVKPPPKPENLIPRGQPKSGRFWKTPKTKASTLIHTRGLRRAGSFEKKEKLRAELKHIKEVSRARLEERKRLNEEKKERRRANIKKQEENRKKSEIVQVIKNPAKIKRMRKKQLRNIEKRDTTNM